MLNRKQVPNFVLASASPARRKLLEKAGIELTVCRSNFDESQVKLRDPQRLVETLATRKAETIAPQFSDSLILGCDSLLAIEGEIYGKPESSQIAIARWQRMRGQRGKLYTGHTLIDQVQERKLVRCGVTEVYFLADISEKAIEAYVATGEPLKCAGGFAIEGKGGLFVEKLVGCHTNVIGLSLPLLHQMIKELGYGLVDFW